MYYVEYLFAKKMLFWFCGIISVLALAGIGLADYGHTELINFGGTRRGSASLSAVFSVAGYVTCVMATMISATLARDREHLPYIWTRPQTRTRTALQYFAIDAATILTCYIYLSFVAVAIIYLTPFAHVNVDAGAAATFVRYLAIPLMWFGMVEAASSWTRLKAGAVSGMSWAVFWILLALNSAGLPTALKSVIAFLNIFNPLSYFTQRHGGGIQVTGMASGLHNTLPFDYTMQAILAYAIYAGALALAAYLWRRMEV